MKALTNKNVYKKLIDHMNEAVWVGDKSERTIYVNDKFAKMLEYEPEEMLGKKSYVFWDKETKKKVAFINKHHRKQGVSSSYEGNLLTKSGERIPVLLSGSPLSDGGTIGIMTNLTKLKEKETKEKILNTALAYSRDAIIVFDKDLKIQTWNKGAKLIFGYKSDELINSKITKILLKDEIEEIINNSKIKYNFEVKGKHKNKTNIIVSSTITPILDSKKNIQSYLLIARDITNQVKFEEDLSLKYNKIKEAYNKFGILRRQQDYIFELISTANKEENKKYLYDFIVTSIIMLTKVDACILRTYNPKTDTLDLQSMFGVTDWEGKSSLNYKNSLTEKAFKNKEILKLSDVGKNSKYQAKYLAKKNNLCSLLLIPLVFKKNLIGSISLYASPEKKSEIFENDFIPKYAKIIASIL